MAAARAVCVKAVLAGLDEEVLEYLLAAVDDFALARRSLPAAAMFGAAEDGAEDDALAELRENICSFLLSAEYCEDESAAAAKCDELLARLCGQAAGEGSGKARAAGGGGGGGKVRHKAKARAPRAAAASRKAQRPTKAAKGSRANPAASSAGGGGDDDDDDDDAPPLLAAPVLLGEEEDEDGGAARAGAEAVAAAAKQEQGPEQPKARKLKAKLARERAVAKRRTDALGVAWKSSLPSAEMRADGVVSASAERRQRDKAAAGAAAMQARERKGAGAGVGAALLEAATAASQAPPPPLLTKPICLDGISGGVGGLGAAGAEGDRGGLMGADAAFNLLTAASGGLVGVGGTFEGVTRAAVNTAIDCTLERKEATARELRQARKAEAAARAAAAARDLEEAAEALADMQLTEGMGGADAAGAAGGGGGGGGGGAQKGPQDICVRDFDLPRPGDSGGEQLLTRTTLRLARGRCYGLAGRNGTGKTTLLRAIARRALQGAPGADAAIPGPDRMSILFVKHEVPASEQPVLERVLAADRYRTGLLARQADLEGALDLGGTEGVLTRLALVQGHDGTGCTGGGKTQLEFRGHSGAQGQQQKAQQAARLAEADDDKRRLALVRDLEGVGAALEACGAATAPGRAAAILRGLGFTPAMLAEPTTRLSGGWRMRVALASALFLSPHLLLLDEPTTHLDLEAVLWLEHFLGCGDGDGVGSGGRKAGFGARRDPAQTIVVVSHDQHFLNCVATDILRLDHRRHSLAPYRGNYEDFRLAREEERLRARRAREVQERKRASLQKFVDKNAKAATLSTKIAKQRKSKMNKLERVGMEAAAEAQGKRFKMSDDLAGLEGGGRSLAEVVRADDDSDEESARIRLPDPGSIGRSGPVVRADGVAFAFPTGDAATPNPTLFADLDLWIGEGSRVALLGPNGAGKTTLLKVLTGVLAPTAGRVQLSPHARIETIDQHQVEQLDQVATPLEFMMREIAPELGGEIAHAKLMRSHLGRFGVSGELATQQIRTLSGGQRCRVVLARALFKSPHVLMMDEPTNYLDLETVEGLISALATFKGAVLIVSHDQHFIDRVVSEAAERDPSAPRGQLLLLGGGEDGEVRLLDKFSTYRDEVATAMARARR